MEKRERKSVDSGESVRKPSPVASTAKPRQYWAKTRKPALQTGYLRDGFFLIKSGDGENRTRVQENFQIRSYMLST